MRRFIYTFAAVVVALGIAGVAKAQDTIRLDDTGDAKVQDLLFDGQVDTERLWWGRPFIFRPFAWRPFTWGSFYRPFVFRPFFRPYFAFRPFWGYRPWLSASLYTPSFYNGLGGSVSYGGYPACSYDVGAYSNDAQFAPYSVSSNKYSATVPAPVQIPGYAIHISGLTESGFIYDGGPSRPMPYASPGKAAPLVEPARPTVPLDGRLISIPARPKYSYPAYGDDAHVPAPAPKAAGAASTVRLAFPAYGQR